MTWNEPLIKWQNRDGSWPSFVGDREGSWTTALGLVAVGISGGPGSATERAARWLVAIRGHEAHWLWRWKFKLADQQASINPDKFGWPWVPGANSWVIPTAFAIIALKQFTACNRSDGASRRIITGVEMLFDRACVGGGWNAGNRLVYGMALTPHVEATAIALMALQDEPRTPFILESVNWLRRQTEDVTAVSSLAWSILSLFLFGLPVRDLQSRLAAQMEDVSRIQDNATLAVAALGLACGETIHPFAVIR
jgi:hypothetical protein